jgi:hypothetical protein
MGGSAVNGAETATCPIPHALREPLGRIRNMARRRTPPATTRIDFMVDLQWVMLLVEILQSYIQA